ncbi:MAG: hypothetical protein ACQEP8_00005 [Chlamydiota bacterium]
MKYLKNRSCYITTLELSRQPRYELAGIQVDRERQKIDWNQVLPSLPGRSLNGVKCQHQRLKRLRKNLS